MSDRVVLDGDLSLSNVLDGQVGTYSRYDWRGYSAYEVAVQEGFVGTKAEWLASLQGATGPQGPKGDKGDPGDDYILTAQDKQEIAGLVDTPVDDVQINGTSIVQDGVANVPVASSSKVGVVRTQGTYGLNVNGAGIIYTYGATSANIKAGTDTYRPINPSTQHEAAFYGLTKAAGVDMSSSSNPVGTYTDEAKSAIQGMLGVPSEDDVVGDVQVNGTSVVVDGVANIPIGSGSKNGVVSAFSSQGIEIGSGGNLKISRATDVQVKNGTDVNKPIVPNNQHLSAFYGLAKAAGDTTQSQSSNAVGQYTDEAKIAIQKMLGIYQAPWELIEDFTLDEESGFDKTTELNGTLYNFRSAYVRITVPPNSASVESGYGRWYFVDGNGVTLTVESGKYTTNSAQMCKSILIERNANMAMAILNKYTATGGAGMLGYKNISGISFNFGNIQRIYTNEQDKEPAGARVEIYAQRA